MKSVKLLVSILSLFALATANAALEGKAIGTSSANGGYLVDMGDQQGQDNGQQGADKQEFGQQNDSNSMASGQDSTAQYPDTQGKADTQKV